MTCKVLLPQHFQFKNRQSIATSEVGNATANTDLTFTFSAKNSLPPSSSSVPVQSQLTYSRPDGAQILRILTRSVPCSTKREEAEKEINVALVAMNAVHSAATLAQDGDFRGARIVLISAQRLIQRGMKTTKQQREYVNFIVQAEVFLFLAHSALSPSSFFLSFFPL